jgi:hypothetical protein
MTNKEREQRYQDWNDLLYQYLQGDGDEERLCALGELLETIGNLVDVDVSELTEKINAYYAKIRRPAVIPVKKIEVGKVYRVIEDEKGVYTYFRSGDIVRALREPNKIGEVYAQSLMLTMHEKGDWYTHVSNLEEV